MNFRYEVLPVVAAGVVLTLNPAAVEESTASVARRVDRRPDQRAASDHGRRPARPQHRLYAGERPAAMVTDAMGQSARLERDVRGKWTGSPIRSALTRLEYRRRGNVTRIIDPLDHMHQVRVRVDLRQGDADHDPLGNVTTSVRRRPAT